MPRHDVKDETMVRKISKASELVFVTILLFLTISFISFFLFIDKNPFWNIQIGFPFPFFQYNFMGDGCQYFIYTHSDNLLFLLCDLIFPMLISCGMYALYKRTKGKLKQILRLSYNIVFPILIFSSISLLSFFPFPKQARVYDIHIGFPFTYYQYDYVGENCLEINRLWNISHLFWNILFVYLLYFIGIVVQKNFNK